MKSVGIFEAKAKISQLCESVRQTREPILITKRGIPLVKIVPIEEQQSRDSLIWTLRRRFIEKNGRLEDFEIPARISPSDENPLDD